MRGRTFVGNLRIYHVGFLHAAAALAKGTRLSRSIGKHLDGISSLPYGLDSSYRSELRSLNWHYLCKYL